LVDLLGANGVPDRGRSRRVAGVPAAAKVAARSIRRTSVLPATNPFEIPPWLDSTATRVIG
jgi:hypothetical protein